MTSITVSPLADILQDTYVKIALDRSQSAEPVINKVDEVWQPDIQRWMIPPGYMIGEEGHVICSYDKADGLNFFRILVARQTVVNLPGYDLLRPATSRPDEYIIAHENRHGQILAVNSNRKSHAFSIKIRDYNVVRRLPDGKEEVGAYRNFSVVNDAGVWHEGRRTLEFRMTPQEREFFARHGLLDHIEQRRLQQSIGTVEHFVLPELGMALYARWYLIDKILVARLADERRHYWEQKDQLRKVGVTLPEDKPKGPSGEKVGKSEKRSIDVLEAEIEGLQFIGEYPIKGLDLDGKLRNYDEVPSPDTPEAQNALRYAQTRERKLRCTIGPRIRVPVKAVELAFRYHGFQGEIRPGNERKPPWEVPDWILEVKSRARWKWSTQTLVEGDAQRGLEPLKLKYRIRPKSVEVSRDTTAVDEDKEET